MNRVPIQSGFDLRPRGRRVRRGFSLAELMVAIGILGIGLLMVAATFPVGIEQTRTAANETLAPIIADEAFATLDLLLKDRSERVIVRKGANTFRYRLSAVVAESLSRGSLATSPTKVPVMPGEAVFPGNPADPSNGLDKFDLNVWLRGERQDTSKPGYVDVEPLSPPVAGYPSSGQPRYTWSVLYGRPEGSSGLANTIEWTVFVGRGASTTEPEAITVARVRDSWNQLRVQKSGALSGEQLASQLPAGTVLATADIGSTSPQVLLYRVVQESAVGNATIVLDRPFYNERVPVEQVPQLIVYHIPPDSTTGVSPLLRKTPYRRTSLLQ